MKRKTHYQLQSTRGFAACVEPTESNAFKRKLSDDRADVDCKPCLRFIEDRDRLVSRVRQRQEHGRQRSTKKVRPREPAR